MNKNDQPILDNLSLVYELSLSIGKSLDLVANCEGFLKTLMSRKNLSYVSVWIKNKYLPDETDESWATLVYAHPLARVGEKRISVEHPIFSLLKGKDVLFVSSAEDTFAQLLVSEKGITEGGLLIFALGEIGVLKLFSLAKISEEEINQLKALIYKFTISIEGCLAYQQTLRDQEHLEELVKERTEKLAESEERFSQVAESADEWIWEVNADGLYTYASPIVEKILGYKPEEIVGKKHFYDFFAPNIRVEFKKAAMDAFDRKETFTGFVNPNVHKNGNLVILKTSGLPILDEKGILLGYRGADADITEQKQMEEKIIKAEKLAAAVQIASEAAHEIKNPLAVIKAGLYYLEKILPENETAQKTLFRMNEATQRAVTYINDLLNFSKPPVMALKPVDLHKVIEDSINELHQEMLAGIAIEKDFALDVPLLTADPDQLKQVFVNLIKNGVEAMREKGKLKIKSEKLKIKEEEIVQVSISDTGRGITKEDLKHIFDPFFTTKGKGTGLGLAICQRIIEAHKGGIEVKSEVGKGTMFVVRLPVSTIDREVV
ncbi:PAS domain S-box protein [bacterium]|nr:PAS domain S-box protein [bacterium]MBU1782886.1 PAS domain S-box protein [bacterium]